ncbi:acid protease [Flagellimonas alvinocaridis]|uniref:Acid protease n=1 Tax=Flagellimonas alvinocaridis TaxID=2530200 RepID=A0A4S8RM14_9FLAO|nr:retropepsin-like aspartic protease [Allomuricauda alvinocaridis]THV58832.1 acid protease [Allomuricauda alvinocaridis]
MASLKKFLESKSYTKIPLSFTETNHFELAAKINGITGRFILDTGASNTCVGMDRIDFFKMVSESTDVKAAGAGATEMETLISTKNKIKIGDWKKSRLKIVLFDLVHVNKALTSHNALPVDGIIGADILKKGNAVIDYDKKCLYLKLK